MKDSILYPHQRDAIDALAPGKILLGSVGSGKSMASLYFFYHKIAQPKGVKDLCVITTAKKRDDLDWVEEAARFGISTKREDSIDGIQLTVDSWNNIAKHADKKDTFFIFDEQRLVGNGAWAKSFQKIAKNNEWILLTATPGDVWLDYAQVFIANGFYKNISDFKRRHVIYTNWGGFPQVDRYVNTERLTYLRDRILVRMVDQRHTNRHIIDLPLGYDKDLLRTVAKKRWDPWENEPIETSAKRFYLMRKAVNTSPERLSKLLDICSRERRVIVFYNYAYELEAIKDVLGRSGLRYAEWNGTRHEPIPESDQWVYLVQYTAGSEGWNCVDTNQMVFYSLNYSWRIMEQAEGRIDRINTMYTDLYYYRFTSLSGVDKGIEHILKKKEKFNLMNFMKRYGDRP